MGIMDWTVLTDDELAGHLTSIREDVAGLRGVASQLEQEIARRMSERNAKHILGSEYKIRTNTKRDIRWDQDRLREAEKLSVDTNLFGEFCQAFPIERRCSVRNLNELMKLGGPLADAINAAKLEEKEYVTYSVEPVK